MDVGNLDTVSTTAVHPDENIRCEVPARLRLIKALEESERQNPSPLQGKVRCQDLAAIFVFLETTSTDVAITLGNKHLYRSSKTPYGKSAQLSPRRPVDNKCIVYTDAKQNVSDGDRELQLFGYGMYLAASLFCVLLGLLIIFLSRNAWASGFGVVVFMIPFISIFLIPRGDIFEAIRRSSTDDSPKNK